MGFADRHGRARVSVLSPRAFAVCDDCGEWYQLSDLLEQVEYYGRTIKKTGYLVCRHCFDKPQPQLQPYILPPDPIPVRNPRPEFFAGDNGETNYTICSIWPPIYQNGTRAAKLAMLAQVQAITGIPTPADPSDMSLTVAIPNQSITIIPAAAPSIAPRLWACFYNPSGAPIMIQNGASASFGDDALGNTLLGSGAAIVQQGASAYQGVVSTAVLVPGAPVWAFVSPGLQLFDEDGNPLTDENGNYLYSAP